MLKKAYNIIFFLVYCGLNSCREDVYQSTFYFTVSHERDRSLSNYTIVDVEQKNDTLIHHFTTYNKDTYEVLARYSERYILQKGHILWLHDGKQATFSSLYLNKCDTTLSLSNYQIIYTCFKGYKNFKINGQFFNNALEFYFKRRSNYNHIVEQRIFWDKNFAPLFMENVNMMNRYFRFERVGSLPNSLIILHAELKHKLQKSEKSTLK